MQFTVGFTALAFVLASFSLAVNASPVEVSTGTVPADETTGSIMTPEEMRHWLATTDAKLTYVGGEPANPLSTLNTAAVTVVYCSMRVLSVCGGTCNVYNGANTCLNTPLGTACMASTKNIAYCNGAYCGGACGELAACPTPLNDGFCATPGVQSIFTPAEHPTSA